MQPAMRATMQVGAAIATGIALVIAVSVGTPANGPKPANLTGSTVVATLQSGGKVHSAAVQKALLATRQKPDDPAVAKAAARVLINDGRDAGDSRLVGAALGVLRPFMAAPDAEALYLAAVARQYQHDFPGALALLDTAARLDSSDVNVILTRATVQIVLGRFDRAAEDCDRLATLSRPDIAFLCQATNRLLTSDAPQIAVRLSAILERPGLLDPGLTGWARGLLGEIEALHGTPAVARQHFAAVIAENPLALRERLLLADLLLADGQPGKALEVLAPAIPADGVLVRRAIAALSTGDDDLAASLSAELEARFGQNIALGLTAHAREETMYYLRVAKDPALALQRALVNWSHQHEIEDAQLLVDAAMFAGQPDAAVPVVRWMESQSVEVPSFRLPEAVRKAAR